MTPFEEATVPQSEIDRVAEAAKIAYRANREAYRKQWGFPDDAKESDIIDQITSVAREGRTYLNDTYQVNARRIAMRNGWPTMVHLSIKRIDREPIHDWRDLQAIKSEIVGPDCEGVELYPAEARVVDSANQYHLWCIEEPGTLFPFGFMTGIRTEEPMDKSRQRPFAKMP